MNYSFSVPRKITPTDQPPPGRVLALDNQLCFALYAASLAPGIQTMRAKRVRDFRWVSSAEFGQYQFPDADQRTMDQLLNFRR